MKRILLATDFSPLAQCAYAAAAALALRHDAKILLAYEVETLPRVYRALVGDRFSHEEYREHLARRLSHEARHPDLANVSVEPRVSLENTLHTTLSDVIAQEGIDLVVISTHGRTGIAHTVLGSYAERMVRYSPAPVLTYRPASAEAEPFAPRSVLIPFDFSDNAGAVFPMARELAAGGQDVDFTFVEVATPPEAPIDIYLEQNPRLHADLRAAVLDAPLKAERDCREICDAELPGLKCSFRRPEGKPVQKIVETAESADADLILMATHGWSGIKHILLGSVAEKIVRLSPCSVLTVRPKALCPTEGSAEGSAKSGAAGGTTPGSQGVLSR